MFTAWSIDSQFRPTCWSYSWRDLLVARIEAQIPLLRLVDTRSVQSLYSTEFLTDSKQFSRAIIADKTIPVSQFDSVFGQTFKLEMLMLGISTGFQKIEQLEQLTIYYRVSNRFKLRSRPIYSL
jgi:hypothetical protein